jgi:hypothetical protein
MDTHANVLAGSDRTVVMARIIPTMRSDRAVRTSTGGCVS